MIILAIDTTCQAVSVCLWDSGNGGVLAQERVLLERGHDLVLLPMIDRLVSDIGLRSVERIAVAVGPGSFTGMRIGISAALGLGIAGSIDVVGVSSLASFAAPFMFNPRSHDIVACIDARHGRMFAEVFASDGRSLRPAAIVFAADLAKSLVGQDMILAGSGAAMLAQELELLGEHALVSGDVISPSIVCVAKIGHVSDPFCSIPKPLYLKDADVTAPKPKPEYWAG